MKILFLALSLLSLSAFADGEIQQHFEKGSEVNCGKELSTIGCGRPQSDHDQAFLGCVEEHMSQLSKECQRIQQDHLDHSI
jgi:hypothetical protein